ncbi:MAG: hypothetical protein K0Q51_1563 [Rickettsiaceae bacterium]|jgi:hypothetical protein|nr:hypothetical protein [Rickettsiaceae bacterium]
MSALLLLWVVLREFMYKVLGYFIEEGFYGFLTN